MNVAWDEKGKTCTITSDGGARLVLTWDEAVRGADLLVATLPRSARPSTSEKLANAARTKVWSTLSDALK